jgi:hypothetical protein
MELKQVKTNFKLDGKSFASVVPIIDALAAIYISLSCTKRVSRKSNITWCSLKKAP